MCIPNALWSGPVRFCTKIMIREATYTRRGGEPSATPSHSASPHETTFLRSSTVISLVVVVITALACRASQSTSRARSQTPVTPIASESNAFAIPHSTLLCRRSELPRSAPAGLIGYQFEDGRLTVDDRLINTAYDSTGRPVMLIMAAAEKLATGDRATHVLSVSFLPDAPYSGFRVLHPENRLDNTIEPLSASAVAQAHDLAVWLWEHRCSGNVPAPS